MVAIFCHQNPKTSVFPIMCVNVIFDAIHDIMNFMYFDITKFIFCAKSLTMAAIYKMTPKMEAKIGRWHSLLIFHSIRSCSTCFLAS